jgi:hypothetical protein
MSRVSRIEHIDCEITLTSGNAGKYFDIMSQEKINKKYKKTYL